MVKLAIPVIWELSFQDVAGCYHHWWHKAGFDLFTPNIAFLLFLPYSSLKVSSTVSKSSNFLENALT